jgi:hypothetical protein
MPSTSHPHPERAPKARVEERRADLRRRLSRSVLAAIALIALAGSAEAQLKTVPAPPPEKALPPVPPAQKAPPAATAAAPSLAVAVLQGLDKTTARVSTVAAPIGEAVRFGTLVIRARACVKKPPEEPPDTAAFLEIDEARPLGEQSTDVQHLFSGWMFAESPSLSTLEHPVYDVTVLDCKTETGSSAKPSAK